MWNSGSPSEFRKNNFGVIRLVLAALVVFAHSYTAVDDPSASDFLNRLTNGRWGLGSLAVDGFFIASGFLVSESLHHSKRTRDFIIKRLFRLYPGFVVLWMFQSFFLAPLVSAGPFNWYSLKQGGWIFYNLFSLTSYGYPFGGLLLVFPDNPLPGEMNVSLWTLRYELGCYLGLAALGWLGWFRSRSFVSCLFISAWMFYAMEWQLPWNRVLTALFASGAYWPRFATFFLAGVAFWHWKDLIPRSFLLASAALFLIVLAVAVPRLIPVLVPPSWCYLVMWLSYCSVNPLEKFFHSTDMSYGAYLYAFPFQQIVMMLIPGSGPWTVFLVSLPIALFMGFLSWHLVEKPFVKRRV